MLQKKRQERTLELSPDALGRASVPSTKETEAGGPLGVRGQPWLWSETVRGKERNRPISESVQPRTHWLVH